MVEIVWTMLEENAPAFLAAYRHKSRWSSFSAHEATTQSVFF
jgi:hypothetical protein